MVLDQAAKKSWRESVRSRPRVDENKARPPASHRMSSCTNSTPVFACSFSPRRNVQIDQALELRKMPSPPLVGCSPGFRLITPPMPVAIKRVHAVGHVDSRIDKAASDQAVFFIKIDSGGHN
jgi:hypothetical protein